MASIYEYLSSISEINSFFLEIDIDLDLTYSLYSIYNVSNGNTNNHHGLTLKLLLINFNASPVQTLILALYCNNILTTYK